MDPKFCSSELQDESDLVFLEGLFVEEPPDKYSCPICLSPVQREAFLTQCCGKHFCHHCIRKVVQATKRCPMCKSSPIILFPNKERQREIKSLKVWCPVKVACQVETCNGSENDLSRCDCIWSGELGDVEKHLESAHKNEDRWKIGSSVKPGGASAAVRLCRTEYMGKSAPKMRDLYFIKRQHDQQRYNLVSKLVCDSQTWQVIGLNLGLEEGVVAGIDYAEHRLEDKMARVFSKWLDNACNMPNSDRYPYSWEGLWNILTDADKADVAEEYFTFLD